jgi:uncharacterized protein DUF4268
MSQLGRLEQVELREAWKDEAGAFTPWLAEEVNIKLLGDTIGLDLEVQATEEAVGPFRADILAKDTATDHWVLIENQLERTDHTHLGQLLTYAAGLQAVTIVWVSAKMTDEHRAALDWLNEITDDTFNFFGLEIELWQIGDSAKAPKFNVVSQPNDWSRAIRVKRDKLSPTQVLQLEFWTAFKTYMDEQETFIRCVKPYPQNWMNIAIGRGGFALNATVSLWDSEKGTYSDGEVRTELIVYDKDHTKGYFALLEAEKEAIEAEVGQTLSWHNPEDKLNCRIYTRRDADLKDRETWPELHQWLRENLETFDKVFRMRVKRLSPADLSVEPDTNRD